MRRAVKDLIPRPLIELAKGLKNGVMAKKYAGKGVICPICKSEYRVFQTFGLERRKNAKCHQCDSLERHRLMYKYLEDKLGLFDSSKKIKLLHFAPEKMLYNLFSGLEHIDYYPCDLDASRYSYGGGVKIHAVDITKIPFEENTFDFIICNHVLEHIPDDRLAMSELYRVMKKGGEGYYQAPIDYNRESTYEDFSITSPSAREKAFGQEDHVRWYGHDYKDRLKESGLTVKEDRYVEQFPKEEIFKFGLDPKELIYYCVK